MAKLYFHGQTRYKDSSDNMGLIEGWVAPSVLIVLLGQHTLRPIGIQEKLQKAGLQPAYDTIKERLKDLLDMGILEKPSRGQYRLASKLAIDLDEMELEDIGVGDLCVGSTSNPADRIAIEKLFLPYLDQRRASKRQGQTLPPKETDAPPPTRSQSFEPVAGLKVERPERKPLDSYFRFHYRAMASNWIRTDEADQLQKFMDDEEPSRWSLLTGPGGIGKSRLAWELCRVADEKGWDAGFVKDRPEHRLDWTNWVPDRNTLIVVDSVLSSPRKNEVILWTQELEEIMAPRAGVQVRVVFVDRPQSDAFWDDNFREAREARHSYAEEWHPAGSIQNGEPVKEPVFRTLTLAGVDLDAVAKLMRESAEARRDTWKTKAQNLEEIDWRAQAEDYLRRIDPLGRPLFAMMAGEIICKIGSLTNLTLEGIGELILQQLLSDWRKAGIDEPHLNLLFLATVMNGVDLSDPKLADPRCAPYLPIEQNRNRIEMLAAVSGGMVPIDGNVRLERLLPDPSASILRCLGYVAIVSMAIQA